MEQELSFIKLCPKELHLSSSSPVLDEGLDQLRPQAGQSVPVSLWKAKALTRLWHLPTVPHLRELEVQVGWEGPEQVQDVAPSIVSQNAFGLNARAKLHWAVAMVEHLVTLDSQRFTGLIQKLQKPGTK